MSWPTVALGELVSLVMGQAPLGTDCNKSGQGTIFVKAGEFDARFPLVREWTTNPLKLARKGDILVCVVGATAGKVNDGIDCAIGRSVAAVRPDTSRLAHGYIYWFMQQKSLELRRLSQGLAQGVITRDMIANLEIPLPPLEEQKRIAAILDQADALRRLRARAHDRLNALGQAIFHEMFGDVATNSKAFQMGKIGDLAEETQYGTSEKASDVGAYPVLRMNNLTYDGRMDLTSLKYMELKGADVAKHTVVCGDMLFNRTNSPELVGKTAVYRGAAPMAFAGYLVRLRTNSLGNTDYISAVLNSSYGKSTLRGMCKSIIGMANINAKELCKITLPIPPRELQDKFAHKLAEIEKSRPPYQAAFVEGNALFSSLQARAFRGDL